jgi:hypothetical protein
MTTKFFEINDGSGNTGKDGHYNWATYEEAKQIAIEFKNDPRSHNPKMTDENVTYWQNRTYTIVKKTIITEELDKI